MADLNNEELRGRTRECFSKISSSLDPKGYVVDKLFEKKVITMQQLREIDGCDDTKTRTEKLLSFLFTTSHPQAFVVFRQALQTDYDWMVEQIDGKVPGRGTKEDLSEKKSTEVTQEKADLQKRINNFEYRPTSVEDENNNYKEKDGNSNEKSEEIQSCETQASSESPVPLPRLELENEPQNVELSKSWEPKNECPIKLHQNIDLIQIGDDVKVESSTPVVGISWLENRIYIVCLKSKNVFVFDDQEPAFKQLQSDQIAIAEMQDPKDLIACAGDKSLFIADRDQKCLWKRNIHDKEARKWPIQKNRRPKSLSISPDNELLALVTDEEEEEFFVYIYKCSTVSLEKKILLQPNIQEPLHVLRVSVDQFIVIHRLESSGEDGRTQFPWKISRVTPMGDILASFDPLKLESISETRPEYMTVGPDGTILVADQKNNRAIMLDSELTTGQVLLKHDRLHSLNEPHRICYVPQKQLHIIGQWTRGSCGMFSIFAPQQK